MRRIAIVSAILTLICSVMAMTATPLFANPDFDLGPPVNAKAPDIGSPPDFTRTPRPLPPRWAQGGTLFFPNAFFRSRPAGQRETPRHRHPPLFPRPPPPAPTAGPAD